MQSLQPLLRSQTLRIPMLLPVSAFVPLQECTKQKVLSAGGAARDTRQASKTNPFMETMDSSSSSCDSETVWGTALLPRMSTTLNVASPL